MKKQSPDAPHTHPGEAADAARPFRVPAESEPPTRTVSARGLPSHTPPARTVPLRAAASPSPPARIAPVRTAVSRTPAAGGRWRLGQPRFGGPSSGALVLLAALAWQPAAAAAPPREALPWLVAGGRQRLPPVPVRTPDGRLWQVERCSTPAGPVAARAEVEAALDLWRSLAGPLPARRRMVVPVAVHVVRGRNGEGDVTDAQVAAQLRVLNRAFRRSGFRFETAAVERIDRKRWHRGCAAFDGRGRLRGTYRGMTRRLSVAPDTTLNLYTCDLASQGTLGFAMPPWFFLGESPLDAVVVDFRTLPGGGAAPYDEGDTVVHAVGHWLGLDHTFQEGCAAPGDGVADTPYQALPARGCPVGRDSCPDDPGLDPVTNYMDTGDDACAAHFSKGQRRRAKTAVDLYRPKIGGR